MASTIKIKKSKQLSKVVKKLSKSGQEVVKKCQKVSKICQKFRHTWKNSKNHNGAIVEKVQWCNSKKVNGKNNKK
jgi:hypothetical protein